MTGPKEEKKLFKEWFDEGAAQRLGAQINRVYREFDPERFRVLATRDLESLEFSDRIKKFSKALSSTLPADPPQVLKIVVKSLPQILPGEESVKDGFLQWPLGQFIADHGLNHVEESFEAMLALTQRFSAEFAVRPFAERYLEETINRLLDLTRHPSSHVRRWCSEGLRPRLPWGGHLKALIKDPAPLWPILEALKDDTSLYVRRSVANNLNDISKDHPELVVERCRRWMTGASQDRAWLVKHGLRSLVKAGHPGALEVMGFSPPRKLKAGLSCDPLLYIGDSIELQASLKNEFGKSQNLVVDFVLHYLKSNGQTSGKVFKWKNLVLEAGSSVELVKRHPMRRTTIRKLYPGRHQVKLQVNGKILASAEFELVSC